MVIAFSLAGKGRAMKPGNLEDDQRFCGVNAGCVWETGYPAGCTLRQSGDCAGDRWHLPPAATAAHRPCLGRPLPGRTAQLRRPPPLDQSTLGVARQADPRLFLSQSSSIFSLPISLYKRSGSRCAAIGLGPRLPSNSALACSWIAFFHCPTCTG